jgi:L-arabinose 1-dehydrogenase [NAD(P)+]
MARIALTGAGGNIGRELLDAFDGPNHDLRPFTHSEHEDVDSERLDVTDPDDVRRKIDDVDVVVHLAGAASVDTDWDTAVETNVHGTKHVLEAAVENGVDRVVFSSSNHAVGTYNIGDVDDPESMTTGPLRTVPADAPPRHLLRREQGGLRGAGQLLRRRSRARGRQPPDRNDTAAGSDASTYASATDRTSAGSGLDSGSGPTSSAAASKRYPKNSRSDVAVGNDAVSTAVVSAAENSGSTSAASNALESSASQSRSWTQRVPSRSKQTAARVSRIDGHVAAG